MSWIQRVSIGSLLCYLQLCNVKTVNYAEIIFFSFALTLQENPNNF